MNKKDVTKLVLNSGIIISLTLQCRTIRIFSVCFFFSFVDSPQFFLVHSVVFILSQFFLFFYSHAYFLAHCFSFVPYLLFFVTSLSCALLVSILYVFFSLTFLLYLLFVSCLWFVLLLFFLFVILFLFLGFYSFVFLIRPSLVTYLLLVLLDSFQSVYFTFRFGSFAVLLFILSVLVCYG